MAFLCEQFTVYPLSYLFVHCHNMGMDSGDCNLLKYTHRKNIFFNVHIAIITKGKRDKAKTKRQSQIRARQEREKDKKKNQDTMNKNQTKEIHCYYSKFIKKT